jgi:hypothetical protein
LPLHQSRSSNAYFREPYIRQALHLEGSLDSAATFIYFFCAGR